MSSLLTLNPVFFLSKGFIIAILRLLHIFPRVSDHGDRVIGFVSAGNTLQMQSPITQIGIGSSSENVSDNLKTKCLLVEEYVSPLWYIGISSAAFSLFLSSLAIRLVCTLFTLSLKILFSSGSKGTSGGV